MKPLFLVLFLALLSPSLQWKKCVDVVCASVVSKCMLTGACKCEISKERDKCDCCDKCVKCLASDYFQCCSCLDMCNPEELERQKLEQLESQVGDFPSPFDQLYEAIAKEGQPSIEGIVIRYPADAAIEKVHRRIHKYHKLKGTDPTLFSPNIPRLGVDCAVIFLRDCFNAAKCRDTCDSIGAAKFRFFFDGCCECIGSTCLDYGINESRCPDCSYLDEFDGNLYLGEHYDMSAAVNNRLYEDEKFKK